MAAVGEDEFAYNAEAVARAGVDGLCFVAGDRYILKKLSTDARLSDRGRMAFQKFYERSAQSGSLVQEMSCYAEIYDGPTQTDKRGEKTVFKINYRDLTNSSLLLPVLLAENFTDCNVLVELAILFAEVRQLGIKVAFDKRPGGGSTTAQVLHETLKQSWLQPVFLFCDSDRKYPGGDCGATANSLIGVVRDSLTPRHVFVFDISPGRELENNIPLSIIESALRASGMPVTAVSSKIEQLRKCMLHAEDAVLFADLKTGMTVVDLDNARDPVCHSFWSQAAAQLHSTGCSRICVPVGSCPAGAACTCFIIPSISKGALSAVETLLKSGRYKGDVVFTEHTERFIRNVVSMGCASHRVYVA